MAVVLCAAVSFCLDMPVDGVGDRLVRAARFMLVDHGRALAVVALLACRTERAPADGARGVVLFWAISRHTATGCLEEFGSVPGARGMDELGCRSA